LHGTGRTKRGERYPGLLPPLRVSGGIADGGVSVELGDRAPERRRVCVNRGLSLLIALRVSSRLEAAGLR
jgi:hypothetical protein